MFYNYEYRSFKVKMNKQKIFLVEDDKFYAAILKKTLTQIGDFEIEEFNSGGECLSEFHRQPDIIFLDYQLGIPMGLKF